VSEQCNPELFWAIRGGGGNFGIVTSFEYHLHEVGPEVMGGQLLYSFDQSREVLQFYRDFMSDAPDEVQCYAFFFRVPPIPAFPERYHGQVAIGLAASDVSSVTGKRESLKPLREFGDPFMDTIQAMPYVALQQQFDAGMPAGQRYYSKGHYLKNITDNVIDTVISYTEELPGVFTLAYFEPMGGAVSRVEPGATAFPHRGAPYSFHILAGWTDAEEDERLLNWTQKFHRALKSHSTGGVYVNLLGDNDRGRVREAYGDNFQRLSEIKKQWDPDNLFKMNQNIVPKN
jgi:FAD/FMN-containing dehydrogenase